MMRLRAAPLVALALLAACSDDPTAPQLATSVEVLSRSEPFDETTLAPGDTLRLSASARDAAGREIPGRPIRWSSDHPDVATVDASGLVRAVGLGRARIVAASDTAASAARVNVAAPVSGRVECEAGARGALLEVGGIRSTTGWDAGTLCFEGGENGAEYLLVPFHSSRGAGSLPLSLELGGALPLGLDLTPSRAPAPAGTAAAPRPDEAFHLRLRERVHPSPARLRGPAAAGGPLPSLSLAVSVPAVGERLRLNVEISSADGCSQPDYRTGRVVAVTRRAIVVADTANPAGGFSAREYEAFGSAFDDLVYPLNVVNFGEPSDVDANERVVIFFTAAVNDLTESGSGQFVGGYFFDRDLFSRSGATACAGSNAAEMFYMMVPDPIRYMGGEAAFSKESVAGHTVAVIGHEFQHLINASRRLHVRQAPTWETTWLNEGLSHIAEELLFYRVSGLGPGGNEDGSGFTSAQWLALEGYQRQNLDRYIRFLRGPHNASAIGGDDLAARGAIWGFLRYAADRQGGDEGDLWYRLANSDVSGVDNLRSTLGTNPLDWVHDWTLSLYLDDAGLDAADPYLLKSWNHRKLLPLLRNGPAATGGYPLRVLRFQFDHRLGLDLPGGTSAFIRLSVPAGEWSAVRVTSGGLPAPEKLRLSVIRTR